MMKKIEKSYLKPEEKNNLYEMGFRFIVQGDYKILKTTDPWSGMPDVGHNLYAFSKESDAKEFATKQKWPFNKEISATVEAIPEHTETLTEYAERQAKEKAERKAKKEANEAKKAAEAGMTIEEYKAEKKRISLIKSITKEIPELEKEIAKLEKELARKKNLLKELES